MVLSCNMFAKIVEKLHKSKKFKHFYHKEVRRHQVRCYHSFLVEVDDESVNLIDTNVKIENYNTMMENN